MFGLTEYPFMVDIIYKCIYRQDHGLISSLPSYMNQDCNSRIKQLQGQFLCLVIVMKIIVYKMELFNIFDLVVAKFLIAT